MDANVPLVLGAAVYPCRAASTRLRLGLLASPLEQRGAAFLPWTYLGNQELNDWVTGKRLAPAARGLARIPVLMENFRSGSALVVQREILPWNSLLVERAAQRRMPIIWDVDDAMWLSSEGIRSLVRGSTTKYAKLATMATEVWAGSDNVASWCQDQGARKVRVVPTVTPIPEVMAEPVDPPRLAWVGTPATVPYLNQALAANEDAFREWVIEVVGARPLPLPSLRLEWYPWSQENEHRALSRAWAGIYPVNTAHAFSTGKSALKAVLMGAYGLPIVGTWTQSNAAVIRQGETGILIQDNRGWGIALEALSDRTLRDRMGWAARKRIEIDYNPLTWGAALVSALAEYLD